MHAAKWLQDVSVRWSQSKQRNEVADAKPVVLTLKVKLLCVNVLYYRIYQT